LGELYHFLKFSQNLQKLGYAQPDEPLTGSGKALHTLPLPTVTTTNPTSTYIYLFYRKHFQELQHKVHQHQKTIHKLRVQLHGLNEQQTTNQNKIQNLQGIAENQESSFHHIRTAQTMLGKDIKDLIKVKTNSSERFFTLEKEVFKGKHEKENFAGAVYDMNKEIKSIHDSIRDQKSELEQLQFTFQHVIEAEFGKPKHNSHKSKPKGHSKKEDRKLNTIPLYNEIGSGGSGDIELDLGVSENIQNENLNQRSSGDLDSSSNDLDQGSGDLDPDRQMVNPATPTHEPPHSTTMFTSTDSDEDEVDITNNGILHIFPNDFAEKFIKQANEINNLKVKVKSLNITVKNLEVQSSERPAESAQTSADLLLDTFTNLTQQMLTLQQWNTVNVPNITKTYSNQKELDKLFAVVMETKNMINDLVKDTFEEKIQYEEKLSQIDFKVFQINKTMNTAVRRLEKYKYRSRDTNDDFVNKIAETV
jgi:predicted transcriptional regulator